MHGENSSESQSASDSHAPLSIPTISLFPELTSSPRRRRITPVSSVKAATIPLHEGRAEVHATLGEVLGIDNLSHGAVRALLGQPGGAHLFLSGLVTLAVELSGIDDIRRGAALFQVDRIKGLLHIVCGGLTFKLWFLTLGGSAAAVGTLAGFRAFMPLTKCLSD